MPREWDATTYDSLPLPHHRWSERTLRHLELEGHETIVDAGAGTGRDVPALVQRLPRGRVIALDGSEAMLQQLRTVHSAHLDQVTAVRADLDERWPLTEEVDAVYSVATFHWIHDHERLFSHVAEVLRPGGQFVAECGGHGCVARVRAAIADVLGRPADATHFADVGETVARLESAGFRDVHVDLIQDPTRLEPGEQLITYLGAVVLGPYLDEMPETEHRAFVGAVVARLDEPVVDYVRLNLRARR